MQSSNTFGKTQSQPNKRTFPLVTTINPTTIWSINSKRSFTFQTSRAKIDQERNPEVFRILNLKKTPVKHPLLSSIWIKAKRKYYKNFLVVLCHLGGLRIRCVTSFVQFCLCGFCLVFQDIGQLKLNRKDGNRKTALSVVFYLYISVSHHALLKSNDLLKGKLL